MAAGLNFWPKTHFYLAVGEPSALRNIIKAYMTSLNALCFNDSHLKFGTRSKTFKYFHVSPAVTLPGRGLCCAFKRFQDFQSCEKPLKS